MTLDDVSSFVDRAKEEVDITVIAMNSELDVAVNVEKDIFGTKLIYITIQGDKVKINNLIKSIGITGNYNGVGENCKVIIKNFNRELLQNVLTQLYLLDFELKEI